LMIIKVISAEILLAVTTNIKSGSRTAWEFACCMSIGSISYWLKIFTKLIFIKAPQQS